MAQMKIVGAFIIWLLIMLALSFIDTATADDPHHEKVTINYSVKGVASAISAAQCHFDGGSYDLQLCGGYGNAFGQDAVTIGAGYKIGDFLFNATETNENGEWSRGFGVNLKVKLK